MKRGHVVCPKCGGRLYRDSMIQFANRSRVNLDGSVSVKTKLIEIGPEEAEIIFCESCGKQVDEAYTTMIDGKETLIFGEMFEDSAHFERHTS